MVNPSSSPHEQLGLWLHRLVEIMRDRGGSTWIALMSTVAGKTAAINIDEIQYYKCPQLCPTDLSRTRIKNKE